MAITDYSKTHAQLFSQMAHHCLSFVKVIEANLQNNDLSPEHLQFWLDERQRLITSAESAINCAQHLIEIYDLKEKENQMKINALVPFKNGRNPLLN